MPIPASTTQARKADWKPSVRTTEHHQEGAAEERERPPATWIEPGRGPPRRDGCSRFHH
jgi:hypothetical protein